MRRNYLRDSSAESLYRKAQADAKQSGRSKTGPAQIEVVKKYSGASRLFEEEGDFYKAKEALEGAVSFLGRAGDPKVIKKIENRLDEVSRKLPVRQRSIFGRYVFAAVAIASFIGALLFISFDLTGSVVMGQARTNLSFWAAGLFVLGLIFVFCYFKNKK